MDFHLKTKTDRVDEVLNSFRGLVENEILAGIPQETAFRPGEKINNAEIGFLQSSGVKNGIVQADSGNGKALSAYLHATGDARSNIPPRPFLQPPIEAHKEKLTGLMGDAISTALSGGSVPVAFNDIGLFTAKIIKDWFTDPRNAWAPNAPYTIQMKGSARPLIDTGELRKSISYAIRPSDVK